MAKDPKLGNKVTVTVTGLKGECNAGHNVGEQFEISCWDSGGLCGWFYHAIFSDLTAFQFGGNFPWWEGDTIALECPDRFNLLTVDLRRTKRD